MAVADLGELLARFRLSAFSEPLAELGVETSEDLNYLQDADLEKIGMPVIHRRKLLEACGAEWRTQERVTERPEEKQVSKSNGHPKAEPCDGYPIPEYAEDELGRSELLDVSAEQEFEHLLQNYRHRVEDFAAANDIDMAARSQLMNQEPAVAVRVCGLLGRGQAFVMRGMRKPSAAVGSRIRAAVQEFNGNEFASMIPYEDWPRLLEGFAEVNSVSASVRAHLEQLDRAQALRVMGFTSGLRFVVPRDGSDADREVQARVRAALKGEAMAPLIPRTEPGSHGRAVRHGVVRSRSPRGHGLRPMHANAKNQDRGQPALRTAQHYDERFPMWRNNLETFLHINELDDRTASVLFELSQESALRVMGLLGHVNSFVIRGARNPNAAVMNRVKSIQQHTGDGHDEAYANLLKLVEEFVAINGLDDRGAEAMRQLSPQGQLQVMGFTAENSFTIRGAKNPSAALMGRIQQARKVRE